MSPRYLTWLSNLTDILEILRFNLWAIRLCGEWNTTKLVFSMFRDNLLANNHWLTLSSSTFRLVSKTEKTVFCYLDMMQTNHLQHLVYHNTPTWLIKFYDRQYQMLYISLKKCHKMPQKCLKNASNWVPRESKQSAPLPSSVPHSKLGCLLFITGSGYRGTTLQGGGGGGKA